MGVVSNLKRRFGSGPPPQFECELCATRFEREPMNCPACGSADMKEV